MAEKRRGTGREIEGLGGLHSLAVTPVQLHKHDRFFLKKRKRSRVGGAHRLVNYAQEWIGYPIPGPLSAAAVTGVHFCSHLETPSIFNTEINS